CPIMPCCAPPLDVRVPAVPDVPVCVVAMSVLLPRWLSKGRRRDTRRSRRNGSCRAVGPCTHAGVSAVDDRNDRAETFAVERTQNNEDDDCRGTCVACAEKDRHSTALGRERNGHATEIETARRAGDC